MEMELRRARISGSVAWTSRGILAMRLRTLRSALACSWMVWRSSFESQRTFNSASDLGAIGRTFTSRLNVTNLVALIDDDDVEAVEPVEVELVDEVLRDDRRGRRREAEMDPKEAGFDLVASEAFRSLDDEDVSFLSEF